jgi:hypothetical protein
LNEISTATKLKERQKVMELGNLVDRMSDNMEEEEK